MSGFNHRRLLWADVFQAWDQPPPEAHAEQKNFMGIFYNNDEDVIQFQIPETTFYVICAIIAFLLIVNIIGLCYSQYCRRNRNTYIQVSQIASSDEEALQ
eukprot:356779_1